MLKSNKIKNKKLSEIWSEDEDGFEIVKKPSNQEKKRKRVKKND